MSEDKNRISGEENKSTRRRINPLLLLGEPENPSKETRAVGSTGVRRPSQEQLVETGEFTRKQLPPLPPPVKSEPSIVVPVEENSFEVEEGVGSSGSDILGEDVESEPDTPARGKSLPAFPAPKEGTGKAVRGINPLLLPGGGNPLGGRRVNVKPPQKIELPLKPVLPVEGDLSDKEPVEKPVEKPVDSNPVKKTRDVMSPIGDSLSLGGGGDVEDNQGGSVDASVSAKNVHSEILSDQVVEGDKSSRRINPLFLAGEEKELAKINPHLHGQRRLRANSVILLPGGVEKPALPKRDTSRLLKPSEPAGEQSVGGVDERGKAEAKTEAKVGEKVDTPQYDRRLDSHIEADEWNEENYDTDTSYGLGGEKEDESAARKTQFNRGFHLTSRDIIIIRFLARYRYAYGEQIARLVDTTPRNISARLRVLEKRGILRKENITDRQYLWTSKKGGNVLADINFPEIRKGSISYVTLPHTLGLVSLAVELEREAGGKDLLGEGKDVDGEWVPPMDRWKFGIWGNPEGKTLGYMTVSEREIRQGQLRTRGNRDAKEMREMVHLVANSPEPVELEEGQEGLFVIYGQASQGGEHIPDLVVVKERDPVTGRPQHIAIELELTPKQPAEWKRILRNFRDNGEMYAKVVYFTHKRSIATALQKADEEVGLGERLVIRKYIPTRTLPFWG